MKARYYWKLVLLWLFKARSERMQDIVVSLLLSELVYKAQDGLNIAERQREMAALAAEFPASLVAPVEAVVWSPPKAQHGFLVSFSYRACRQAPRLDALHFLKSGIPRRLLRRSMLSI